MVVKVTDVLRIRRSGVEVERRRENDFDSPFVLLFQFKVHVVRVVVVLKTLNGLLLLLVETFSVDPI